MKRPLVTGVIGDSHPGVEGFAAIRAALQHAATALSLDVDPRWIPSTTLAEQSDRDLAEFDALWCGPWGPYANADDATRVIRFAREHERPFLGTCAGFQHAAIEYARSVLGLSHADHAEANPATPQPVITALSEPLIDRTAAIVLDPGSQTARIYRRTLIAERYRCRFGLNPAYLRSLHGSGLRVAGVDETGAAMVLEFVEHPFFVATLYLPEIASRSSAPHPLVIAYLQAAIDAKARRQ